MEGTDKPTAASHIQFASLSGAIWWPISIFLHHIPESWRLLWKTPMLISTLSSGEWEESEAATCNKGHVLDLSEWYRGRVCLLSCKDVYRRCWKLTLCVTTTDWWAEMVFGQIPLPQYLHTGRQADRQLDIKGRQTDSHLLFFLFYFDTVQTVVVLTFCCLLLLYYYLPLKVKHSPIVLWELISCWCSCCYCCWCCESRYSACACRFDLITSKECLNYNGERLQSNACSFITHNYVSEIWLVSDEHLPSGEKTTVFF